MPGELRSDRSAEGWTRRVKVQAARADGSADFVPGALPKHLPDARKRQRAQPRLNAQDSPPVSSKASIPEFGFVKAKIAFKPWPFLCEN